MNQLQRYGLTDRFVGLALMYPELTLARVSAQHRGCYQIVTETGELTAEVSGKFRFETTELAKFPAVGDFVMVAQISPESPAIIHHVLQRKSIFLRSAVGTTGEAQSIAANIDTVFICMSLNDNFNLSRLERYLSVAWDSGATPVVVLTKADLCQDCASAIAEVERVSLFADVIALSVFEPEQLKQLERYLKAGTTTALIGSSGVGKSTLINALLGESVLATAAIGKADKGRHTTTGRELFCSPFGGVLIDTPGMRELGIESADLATSFEDIETLAEHCRFRDCTHTNEPGCAIVAAIEAGTLDQRRLNNYQKLKTEAGYEGLDAKAIEVQKMERMFKEIGGMKNKRKFIATKPKKR